MKNLEGQEMCNKFNTDVESDSVLLKFSFYVFSLHDVTSCSCSTCLSSITGTLSLLALKFICAGIEHSAGNCALLAISETE